MASESGWQGTGMRSSGASTPGAQRLGLLKNAAADLGKGEAVLGLFVAERAAGLLDGLEGDAAHAGLLEREIDECAELVVVGTLRDGDDEGGGNVVAVEAFEGLLAGAAEVGAAELHERLALERIELQVELESGHVLGEARGEGFVLCDAEAVGVDHEVLDGPRLAGVEDLEKLRVDGGFAA